ncbi:hypothetical protein [Candidatus Poriferisocius sp.]|uniref:hypothetical protein n=1 Tax=Candidatus Poriferisocius sp. TaxID=3101276 RepID=UPI003B028303
MTEAAASPPKATTTIPAGRQSAGLAVIVALAAPILAACAGPSIDSSGCDVALIATMETLDAGLTEDGMLRHGRAHERADGEFFVSAELLPADKDDDFDGDILTWFTEDPAGADFFSVDEHARDRSDWKEADFGVSEDGAITSRGCVLAIRGEPENDECQERREEFC